MILVGKNIDVVVATLTKMVLDKLTPKPPKKELDELVEHILGSLNSPEKKKQDYPLNSFATENQ